MYDCSKEIDLKEYLKESGTSSTSKETGDEVGDVDSGCEVETTGSDEVLLPHDQHKNERGTQIVSIENHIENHHNNHHDNHSNHHENLNCSTQQLNPTAKHKN